MVGTAHGGQSGLADRQNVENPSRTCALHVGTVSCMVGAILETPSVVNWYRTSTNAVDANMPLGCHAAELDSCIVWFNPSRHPCTCSVPYAQPYHARSLHARCMVTMLLHEVVRLSPSCLLPPLYTIHMPCGA